jgi:hypothetical protein
MGRNFCLQTKTTVFKAKPTDLKTKTTYPKTKKKGS